MTLRLFIATVFSFLAFCLFAKNEKTVVASYDYIVPEHISLEEAKRTALDRAKIKAVEYAYGVSIAQSNATFTDITNGETNSRFMAFGGSEVRGEWVETLSTPEYDISYRDGMTVLSVKVRGKIRESIREAIDIDFKILRNGIDHSNESQEFKNGNDMYLSFRSPVEGYLTVYLCDADNAYCLLPYKKQREGYFKVEAQREYILFNKSHCDGIDKHNIDEYVMLCDDKSEMNIIYLIFSPVRFNKSNDEDTDRNTPRQLPIEKFHKWIETQKRGSLSVNVREIPILIKP